jgi:redox-sensitive bicupin YhaK (pirin superfamily)
MKASDVMSVPVIAVRPEATLGEVTRTLAERRISAVPVMEGERLVGIVSEADVLQAGPAGTPRLARDVMIRPVATVGADAPLEEVAALLAARGIRRVPVLRGGRVIGIVSRANLVHALAVRPLGGEAPAQDEREIRVAVLDRLPGEAWWRGDGGEPQRRRPTFGLRRAEDRGHSRDGGAQTYYSFSFGDFYDPAYLAYGPLQAINEKLMAPARGSITYGVRDVEILTYVLEGLLGHKNSLDDEAALPAGAVQCLSAGSGMRFSEINIGADPLRCLQVWLEPDCVGLPAAYRHARFPEAAKRGRLQPIASREGIEGSLRLRQDARIYAGLFDGDEAARLELAPGRLGYVHVARGALTVQGRPLGEGDGFGAPAGAVLALERGGAAEVLVFDLPDANA